MSVVVHGSVAVPSFGRARDGSLLERVGELLLPGGAGVSVAGERARAGLGRVAPRLMVIVDTEEEFDWAAPFDRSRTGVGHLRRIGALQAVFDSHGLRPVYGIGYPIATNALGVAALAPIMAGGRALIGAHMHPWVTPPLDEDVCNRNSFPGNLPAAMERAKLAVLTDAIRDAFGVAPTIYKAGRYGVGPHSYANLEALGYTVDISPMAAFDYRAKEGPDFRHRGTEPVWEGPAGQVLSIPNTGAFVGLLPRLGLQDVGALAVDPRLARFRLPAVLSRLGLSERIALTPEGNTLAEMCRLTRARIAAGQNLFVLYLHSPSVAPGHTPYVRNEAELTAFLARLDLYLAWFRRELGGVATDPLTVRAEWEARRRVVRPFVPRRPRPVVAVSTMPIRDEDLPEVAAYWHANLNADIPVVTWLSAFRHGWAEGPGNHGFMLRAGGKLVGTLGAIYARRQVGGRMVDFCNLTSLVVDEAHRARSMDLLSALLGQKGFSFTNFTPTESVAKMLGLFGFRTLRAGDRIVVNTPTPPALLGLRAAEGRGVLDAVLDGQAARLWRDHRDIPWLRSFAVGRGNDWCLVFWTPSHVKGLRAARIVGVSDTARYLDWNRAIGGHLMLRHGMLASRIEDFMLPENARLGISRPTGTPRLLRGEPADDTQVSFLYSELVALPL